MISIGAILFASDANKSLSGYVYDSNNSPLKGANVELVDSAKNILGTSSDGDGYYEFNNLESNQYTLIITFIGYNKYSKEINLNDDDEYIVNLKIKSIEISNIEIISVENKEEIVGAITLIDSKAMKNIKPIGTQEILQYVPGINGFSDDGIGNSRINIGIRGLNPRRSSRVLILEDGVPIQPALYVYPNMYYNPPSERISKVEVIKGSGAIIYGPQTMGGVINYITRKNTLNINPSIKMTAGNNGYASMLLETGKLSKSKLAPEIQLLLKRGDGFRENNSFYQINSTIKFDYIKSKDESFYSKTNIDYENSNATYTGLTQYSFDTDPNFNPKEDDNFEIFRLSSDLIHTKRISSDITKTTTTFISYFDRRWWRENDIYIRATDIGEEQPNPEEYYDPGNLVRSGDGLSNLGILRTFYVVGIEDRYSFNNLIFNYPNKIEAGYRVYWERFIDDKQVGASPDARSGIYFEPAEEYIDENENDRYDSAEEYYDENENGVYDSGEEFVDANGDGNYNIAEEYTDMNSNGEYDEPNIVGQSHHYETMAFSGFISKEFKLGKTKINPGIRMEIFEQERIDRLNGAQYQDKTTIVFLPGIGFNRKMGSINFFGGIHRGFTPPSSGALNILSFGDDCECGLDVEAEKSWNKELGFRVNNPILNCELSLFHVDIENLVAAGRSAAFKNLGKVQSMGLEFYGEVLLSKVNKLLPNYNISYALLQTNIVDGILESNIGTSSGDVSINGKELPYAPRHTLTIGMKKDFSNKFMSMLDFRYVSSVYTDFENFESDTNQTLYKLGIAGPIPSYYIFNFNSVYKASEKMEVSLSVKNLLDEVYVGSRLHSNPGKVTANQSSGIIPGPRRQIIFSINYKF
tara:strand:+ start:657 stop:3251 length:2595 start_codon:yes stop_codon:yes gene_type:complete